MKRLIVVAAASVALAVIEGCTIAGGSEAPRLSMFVGVDISGSFMQGPYYDDSIDFLARYLYMHLNGLGGSEVPNVLFVSSIGGASSNEPKTFYPRQTFENKSADEIAEELKRIFPKGVENKYTDYNAFFDQVALMVRNRKLVLRPISIVMVSDGVPDVKISGRTEFQSIELKPLEGLARNITLRLLYTSAGVGKNWQTKVPRSRVKIWTQDGEVMRLWKDPKMYVPEKPLEEQSNFIAWVKDNVDFGVSARRVD